MERCILTGGVMLLSVSVVYLISLYERRKSNKAEIDGIPTIDMYIRDRIGNSQSIANSIASPPASVNKHQRSQDPKTEDRSR